MKVLIVGGGLQGLSFGCSLYKNHDVSLVASDLMSRKSRFFKEVYTDIKADKSLYDLLERKHFDVIIPVSDLSVPFISKNKKEIEERYGVKCAVPDFEQVQIVEDKHLFMEFCEQNNVPHPRTMALTEDNLTEASKTIGFPALIKPDFSVGARGITKVETNRDLEIMFPEIEKRYGPCTLQEFIDNQEYYYNVMLYRNANGKNLASAIIKIVRMYPIGAGSSSCCISVEKPDLIKICSDCLEKLDWEGMADFDILQRLDNGEYRIIEINARVPASLRGAAISGVNFPEIIINDVVGNKVPTFKYLPGKLMRYMGLDLMWFMKSPHRFHSTPSWFTFWGKNLFYQDIYKEDASTWWTWLAEGVMKISKRNKKMR